MFNEKKYQILIIKLRIIDVATDTVEKEITRTIDGAERRKWIADTVVWAMFNKKYVEIINVEDDKE